MKSNLTKEELLKTYDKTQRILNANTIIENIYTALCILFHVDDDFYTIENFEVYEDEELLNILKEK